MHSLKSLVEQLAQIRGRLSDIAINTDDPTAGSWLVERLDDIERDIANLDFTKLTEYQLEDFADALSDIEAELKIQFSTTLLQERPRTVISTSQPSRVFERPLKRRGNRR